MASLTVPATACAPQLSYQRWALSRSARNTNAGTAASFFLGIRFAAPVCGVCRSVRRAGSLRVSAFKQTEDVHDWRVKQMVEKCKQYYSDLWTHGEVGAAEDLMDGECVHKDMVWGERLTVGPAAMQQLVAETRAAYPDLWFEVDQVGVCDTTSVFVHWAAQATNLGTYHDHRPSYHNSTLSGITFIRFNKDRSKMIEVVVYRMPFSEDKAEICEREEDDAHTMHLARLHFDNNNGTRQ